MPPPPQAKFWSIVLIAYHYIALQDGGLELKKLNKKLISKQALKRTNSPIDDLTESVVLDQLREPLLDDLSQPTHTQCCLSTYTCLYSHRYTTNNYWCYVLYSCTC